MSETSIQLIYLVSTALFILSLKWMSHPARPAAALFPAWWRWWRPSAGT